MDYASATRGRLAIEQYIAEGHPAAEDHETSFADLIADLIIWAALENIDWEYGLERAERYATEDDGTFCPVCSGPVPAVAQHCPACTAAPSSPEASCPSAPSAETR
ncbi:hypothetical protein ACIQU4_28200 [Streptomyces sp. NPDC090741]|uniref:hypothetical protein n=1 Tax=Streptomyces sp. NPDC090741 TaxID=3365967 RepID=UPI00382A0AA9